MMNATEVKKKTQWKQWAAGITATCAMVCAGSIYGWLTTKLTELASEDSPIVVTSAQIAWMISLTAIGGMAGPFLGAASSDTFGRKMTLLLAGFFYVIGWLVVVFSTSVAHLYVARVILGIGVGVSWTSCPLYVCEIADIEIRGALGTLLAVNNFVGMILACSLGPFLSMKNLSITLLIIPIIFLCVFIWFPESPYYLVLKNKDAEALDALAFFKGMSNPEDALEDLKIVKLSLNQDVKEQNWREKFREMFLPNNRKALTIGVALTLTLVMSGSYTTVAYLQVLFEKANIGLNTNVATLIVLVMGLASSTTATLTIERIGRRPLLITSILGSCVTTAIFASYLLADAKGVDVASINWLPIVVIVLFQIFYNMGLGAVPGALMAELFSTNVKSIANAAMIILDGVAGVVVAKFYQVIADNVGEYLAYYAFAFSCLLGCLFTFFFVPETMNKRFDVIQQELMDNKLQCFKKANKV